MKYYLKDSKVIWDIKYRAKYYELDIMKKKIKINKC